ncbi:MAG: hypothetical protein Q8Q54_00820 [Methylococcales bacterium]|nr:hypothetical protein [Methylococcales bacterium]MDP3837444.1 hypothetical protein [Methylococcales bacterium]
MPIAKLRLVCHGIKQVYLYAHNAQRQAELEGRHSQARAWERDNSSLGMSIAKLRLVCHGIKQIYLYAHNAQRTLHGFVNIC